MTKQKRKIDVSYPRLEHGTFWLGVRRSTIEPEGHFIAENWKFIIIILASNLDLPSNGMDWRATDKNLPYDTEEMTITFNEESSM